MKKCPRCELNYIKDDEELCEICLIETKQSRKVTPIGKVIETDFSSIKFGRNYGTNSRTIYENFCNTLGWDKKKASQFGWQTWMYAEKADTNRQRDVWFIFHSNYTESICNSAKWENEIRDDKIFEAYVDSFPKPSEADRIVFAKNKFSGYEFLGVYTIKQTSSDGRVYERISENYPIE